MSIYARAAQGLGYLAEATGALDLAEDGLNKIDKLTGKRASKFLRKEAAKVMGLKKGDAFKTLPRTVLPIVRDEQLSPALRTAIRAIAHETEGLDAVNTSIGLLTDQVARNTSALVYTAENNFNYTVEGVYQGIADVGAIAANLALHDGAMFYDVPDGYKQSGADIADLSVVIAGVKNNSAEIDDLEAAAAYSINDVYQQGYGTTLKGMVDQSAVVDQVKSQWSVINYLETAAAYSTSDPYQEGYGGTPMGVVDQSQLVAQVKTLVAEVDRLKALTSHVAHLRINGDESWDYATQTSGVFMNSAETSTGWDARGVTEYDSSSIVSLSNSTGVITVAGPSGGVNDTYQLRFEDQMKIVATADGNATFQLITGSTSSPTVVVDEVVIPYENGQTISTPVILRYVTTISPSYNLYWKITWALSAAATLTAGSTNSDGSVDIRELSRDAI
jgi:hypothetical protein